MLSTIYRDCGCWWARSFFRYKIFYEGVITKTSRDRYNLQDSIRNYIVYLKTTQDLKAAQENDDELDGDKVIIDEDDLKEGVIWSEETTKDL